MKYGIVIFPSREVQDKVNNLRKRYDSHYTLIEPHITLKEAFETDTIEDSLEYIEEVTKNFPPFSLRINNIKTFHPITPVLYFSFEDSPAIYNLHKELNSGILFNEIKHKFTPHITFAQDLPPQEIHDIYGRLSLRGYDIEFNVDSIHLVQQDSNGVWHNYKTFLLRG